MLEILLKSFKLRILCQYSKSVENEIQDYRDVILFSKVPENEIIKVDFHYMHPPTGFQLISDIIVLFIPTCVLLLNELKIYVLAYLSW